MKERLSYINDKLSRREIAAYYIWYSPEAQFGYSTEEATDDFLWLIAEIEKLRIENNDLLSPRTEPLGEHKRKRRKCKRFLIIERLRPYCQKGCSPTARRARSRRTDRVLIRDILSLGFVNVRVICD
jgi:hypothetical protein